MIFEAIQHFLTPAAKEVKALGYLREAIAINQRFSRCRAAWADHLEKCHHHILVAAEGLKEKTTLMIIGSGALHDVPVDRLLSRGFRLVLVDIVHLAKVRRQYEHHDQILLLEHDVTGLITPLFQQKQLSKQEIKNSLPKTDLVISLNILSQLPLNLRKYAEKHHIAVTNDFEQTVMTNHLNLIEKLAPKTLIISDLERSYYLGKETVEKETALPESITQRLAAPDNTWDWQIAPKGELGRDISLSHHVACWNISP